MQERGQFTFSYAESTHICTLPVDLLFALRGALCHLAIWVAYGIIDIKEIVMLNEDFRRLLDYQEERIGVALEMSVTARGQLVLLAILARLLILIIRLLMDIRGWEG